MNKEIQKAAQSLVDALESNDYSYHSIKVHMAYLNWQVVEFNDNGINDRLLESMGLSEYAHKFEAFFYRGSDGQLIAIDKKSNKKLELLAHELGHIYRHHEADNLTLRDEQEADEFAQYLLKLLKKERAAVSEALAPTAEPTPIAEPKPKGASVYSLAGAAFLSIILFAATLLNPSIIEHTTNIVTSKPVYVMQESETPTPSLDIESLVYWTPSGNKYHSTLNCSSLKRSTQIYSGSIETTHLEPCSICN